MRMCLHPADRQGRQGGQGDLAHEELLEGSLLELPLDAVALQPPTAGWPRRLEEPRDVDAGTLSPMQSWTSSPGTGRLGSKAVFRSMAARWDRIGCSASSARSVLASCQTLTAALTTSMRKMTGCSIRWWQDATERRAHPRCRLASPSEPQMNGYLKPEYPTGITQ
jgi:hypothetical protein